MVQIIEKYLKSKNLKFDKEKVALTFEEGDDYYGISYDYMGTGIHIPLNEVDEESCKEQGIKVWRTWTYKTN